MAIISGSVIFDKNRSSTIDLGETGLPGVSIVLQDTVSKKRLTVLTDANGNYSFINVPDGDYIIVESYGLTGVVTPADFSTSVVGPVPVGLDPPISIATSPPAGATNLDSTSPNTLSVKIAGANPPVQNFLDGPVIYTPITSVLDTCASISTTNLITAADNGTFGTFAAGTATDTGAPGTAAIPPYPGVTPGFVYTLPQAGSKNPNDGQYTIQNTSTNGNFNNANVWWRMSDHTVGDETGRFMFVNGSNAGQSFFVETLPVTANTDYLFSSWITNMIKLPNLTDPLVGIRILDANGNALYNGNLTNTITANTVVPEWKQVGTVFNSGNNTQLTVEFLSQGGAASGNDYAIDDIKLQPISIPTFTPVKSVNKSYANVGDVVTYTIKIDNTCQSPLTNVSFLDAVPPGFNFVGGSVHINSTLYSLYDPGLGFVVPDIPGGTTTTITFDALAVSIPSPNPTNNIATVNYSYTPVVGGIPNTFTVQSNPTPVTINNATLLTTKTVDNAYAKIGDTLTYTITAKNTGNVPATNVVMTDPLQAGTSFVTGSVSSASTFTGTDPATGITLTNPIPPGGSVTITYKVTVISIPTPNPIPNTATFNYKYVVDPSVPAGVVGTNTTPVANTQVNTALLVNTKSVDNLYANVGDTLTYTLTFKNTGNVNANNVIITDPLPAGTTLVPGSLISSIPYTGTDLASGLTLTAPITPGQTLTITYKVLVGNTIPTPNPIPNTATSSYTFTVNPAIPDSASSNGTTNTVDTQINHADLLSPGNFVKTVDNKLAKVGDTLTYTLVIKNTGNVNANNVVITDPIPNGTAFVAGSITSTIPFNGTSPASGITLTAPIPAGGSVTITYKVTVVSVPNPNPIPNTANVAYTYTSNPSNPDAKSANGSSNTVNTQVNYADLTSNNNFTKTVDKTVDGIGDILTYTFKVKNTGNVPANNVIITDPIPNGTTFIASSITADVPVTGTNPATGITLTNPIPVGATVTVSYQVKVITMPIPNPIPNTGNIKYTFTADPTKPNAGTGSGPSNTVTTQINNADLTSPGNFTKTVDKAFVNVGDILTYTVIAKNTGNVSANNVVITDTLPAGTTLVPGSITSTQPYTGTDPATGITLTNPIPAGGNVTITYKAKVNILPIPNPIVNTANVNYTFTSDPANPNGDTASATTPPATTQVNTADLLSPGNFTKTVDKAYANVGETLTYTLVVKNTGNVSANNVVVTDPIPSGTTFISGSITSTSPYTGTDPSTGITLTNPIPPGGAVTITYKVLVGTTIPAINPILNTANIAYTFTSDPTKPNGNNASGPSNTATTQINHADLTSPGNFTKTADKNFADVGDVITYTVTVKNTGNVPANNVVIQDNLPNGTTLVPGSVVVNVPSSGTDPATGITLTNPIPPGGTVTVTYKVTVVSIPVPDPIENTANINYTYTSDPTKPNANKASGTTPPADTEINHADLISPGNFVKSVDKAFANIGDIVTYTLKITNSGNAPATNVVITDPIPSGTTLVAGSVVVSVPSTGTNPATGITLTNPIPAGETVTISYKVLIGNTLPNPNPIPNTGSVNYNYTVDPANPNGASGNGPSNTVTTQVNHADLTQPGDFTKVADKSLATIGDIITYTITATNSGNVSANNVVITDTIPSGSTFVPGSITASVPFTGTDPSTGITLTNPIPPGGTVTITYQVKVNTVPNPNPMVNVANVNYKYTVDPANPNGASGSAITPPATTEITAANLVDPGNFVKSVDKQYADVGYVLTYTFTTTNTGNAPANNVVITDPIPSGAVLIPGSVTANVPFTGTDPSTGLTLTNPIAPGETVSISFKVTVTEVPEPNPIVNKATVSYTFTSDPNNPNGNSASTTAPDVSTQVNHADVSSSGNLTKTSDKQSAIVGDIITYTITATNTGNVPANNFVITDTIPAGMTFVPGSITANVAFSGTDITSGITLTNPLLPGASAIITFKVNIVSAQVTNPIKNTVVGNYKYTVNPANPNGASATTTATDTIGVTVYNPSLKLVKSTNKNSVIVGDTLTYTITATNTGDLPLGSLPNAPVMIYDMLSSSLEFVDGSVKINGISQPLEDINQGINIGTLDIGKTTIISFDVLVLSNAVTPIDNSSSASFGIQIPGGKLELGNTTSNVISVTPEIANINIVKTADKTTASLGDIITYTVKLTNDGTVDALNVIFNDKLPDGTVLVANTFKINGVVVNGVDLSKGVSIGNIPVGTTKTVSYSVKVLSSNCSMKLINSVSVKFDYILTDKEIGTTTVGPTSTSTTEIDLSITNFKQISIEGNLTIPCQKPSIESINTVKGIVDIKNSTITQTTPGQSLEGQTLTNYKLIINGILKVVVEYTACNQAQSVHSAKFNIPFSTFIILPDYYCLDSKVEIDSVVEDIYNNIYNNRNLFVNATALINVKILHCNC